MVVSMDTPAQAPELKTANTAPVADDAVGQSTTELPASTTEQSIEKKPEGGQTAVHDDGHGVNPLDFQGTVESNNEIPSMETLRKIENYVVLDRHGKSHPFKSLYTGKHVARRVLIIFVRHFFCGNCQEYLRTLSAAITPDALLRLPISTFIAVVGCGDPGLIDMYATATGCPFPVYADPTRRLYAELGMVRTLALGDRPAYMRKSLLRSSLDSIVQGLKQIPKGLATKAGDQRQIGGEFLFEPVGGVLTPLPSPWTEAVEAEKRLGGTDPATAADDDPDPEPKRVTWCHRMRNTRDHAEIPELMEVLGLDPVDDASRPPAPAPAAGAGEEKKLGRERSGSSTGTGTGRRWSRALEVRKGVGQSLAGQMSAMKAGAAVTAPAPAGGAGA